MGRKEVPEKRAPAFLAYLWELRQLFTWAAWLLLVVIAGIFLFVWGMYSQEMASYQQFLTSGDLADSPVHKPVLDFVTFVLTALEVLLPLLGVLLVHDILLRDWRRGTITILVARRSLSWYFAVRLGGIVVSLMLLTALALLLSWWWTPHDVLLRLGDTDLSSWFWPSWLIVLASTLFLMALGLATSHLTANTLVGIILPAACLLANLLFAVQVQQSGQTNLLLSYLLFGWSEQSLSPQPAAWLTGKIVLCVLALCLFGLQVVLLRRLTIQQKSAE